VPVGLGFGAYLGLLVPTFMRPLVYSKGFLKEFNTTLMVLRGVFLITFSVTWKQLTDLANEATFGEWSRAGRFIFVWLLPAILLQVILFGFTERLVLLFATLLFKRKPKEGKSIEEPLLADNEK
jgi:hypothetical protein